MTEIFLIDNARALTWYGRRACTAQSLTAVAHLDNPRVTHSVIIVRNKQVAFSSNVIADS